MRRVSYDRWKLWEQINSAAHGISGEPGWVSSLTQAQVQALADKFKADIEAINFAESQAKSARGKFEIDRKEVVTVLRQIDQLTNALYGPDGGKKLTFGLRPIDTTRNSAGPVPKVVQLTIADGLGPGSLTAKWKAVKRAAYDIQWFGSAAMDQILGSAVSTRAFVDIHALAPGTQIWLRVRALRAGKLGDWSDVATRIANV